MTDPRFFFMPDADFTIANGINTAFRNRWWICHPETKAILFVHVGLRPGQKASLVASSPQCNASEHVVRHVRDKSYPWAEVRFVPLVLKPIDVRDYA